MFFLVYFMMSFVFLFPVLEKFQLVLNLPGFTCKFFILAQGQRRALGSASLGSSSTTYWCRTLGTLRTVGGRERTWQPQLGCEQRQ